MQNNFIEIKVKNFGSKCQLSDEFLRKIASLNDGRIITGHENGFVKIWDAKSHVSIEMFDDRMVDNFLVMKDNRILTIACENGKIWSI